MLEMWNVKGVRDRTKKKMVYTIDSNCYVYVIILYSMKENYIDNRVK